MRIYRYRTNANQFACIEFPGDYHAISQRFLDGVRIGHTWAPLEMDVDPTQGPLGDFPALEATIPVISARAKDALTGLIGDSAELLPVSIQKQPYFALNVLHIVDALDKPNCKLRRYASGAIADVTAYAFKPELVLGAHIFRVPETKFGEVLVSEQFNETVNAAQLDGLRLLPLWTEGQEVGRNANERLNREGGE